MIKKFFLIFLLLNFTTNQINAKIEKFPNGIILNIPDNYIYKKVNKSPYLDMLEPYFGSADIFYIGTRGTVNISVEIIENPDAFIQPILDKIMNKAKNEKQAIKLMGKEIKKLLDRRDYDTLMFLIVGKKNMSSLTKSYPYLEEIISEISSMSNNEINKELKTFKKDIINELNQDGEMSQFVKFTNFELGKDKFNNPFLKMDYKFNMGPVFTNGQFSLLVHEEYPVFFGAECMNCKKRNFSLDDLIAPTFKATKVSLPQNSNELTDQLKNLNELYKSGALTKEEFEKAKKRVLNN